MVLKLSRILRRLLRKHDNFSPLRDELDFIEDYLAIEVARSAKSCGFEKEIDPESQDILVPSMLLQPLIENCIKHGLSNKVEGGTITLRTRLADRRLLLIVEDDGVGIPELKLASLMEQGIGVSNVNERLKSLVRHRLPYVDRQPPRPRYAHRNRSPELQPDWALFPELLVE